MKGCWRRRRASSPRAVARPFGLRGLSPASASNRGPPCGRRLDVAQQPIAIAGSKGLPVFRTPKHSTNSFRTAAMIICLEDRRPLDFNRTTARRSQDYIAGRHRWHVKCSAKNGVAGSRTGVGACGGHSVFFGWHSLGRQSELDQATDLPRSGPTQVRLPARPVVVRQRTCNLNMRGRRRRRKSPRVLTNCHAWIRLTQCPLSLQQRRKSRHRGSPELGHARTHAHQ
jgi:hypothetical protein